LRGLIARDPAGLEKTWETAARARRRMSDQGFSTVPRPRAETGSDEPDRKS
jgi:hypothetical protein